MVQDFLKQVAKCRANIQEIGSARLLLKNREVEIRGEDDAAIAAIGSDDLPQLREAAGGNEDFRGWKPRHRHPATLRQAAGVYALFCKAGVEKKDGHGLLYVGQSRDLGYRMFQHAFWGGGFCLATYLGVVNSADELCPCMQRCLVRDDGLKPIRRDVREATKKMLDCVLVAAIVIEESNPGSAKRARLKLENCLESCTRWWPPRRPFFGPDEWLGQ